MLDVALLCLTSAIYHEARGEPLLGQMAVAEVIVNRVVHRAWPNTVCEVVKQDKQFSFYFDGKSDEMKDLAARTVAESVATSYLEIGSPGFIHGATCYTTTAINNYWTKHYEVVTVIGAHKFMDCTKKL